MKKDLSFLMDKNCKISEAIKKLNEVSPKILLVVDSKLKLIGTITDGDIRRSLIKSFSMDTVVTSIMNSSPIVCYNSDDEKKVQKLLLQNNIEAIPVLDKYGVVCSLKTKIHSKNIPKNETPILIMAGGFGRRLGKLTKNTPKPMLKIKKKPILEHLIDKLLQQGFVNVFISTYFMSDKITNYFNNGSKWGIKIKYISENKPLGTAGSLSLFKDLNNQKDIIVTNADLLTSINYLDMLNFHKEENNLCTICVNNYRHQVPYGVVSYNLNEFDQIVEKPTYNYSIVSGIYIFKIEQIKKIKKNKYLDMPEFINSIEEKHKIGVFPIHENWIDIGHKIDLEKAQKS